MTEERERLNELIVFYNKKIEDLPKGSISNKTINGKKYAYILYRKKNKVITEYIGPIKSEKAANLKAKINERREYETLLKKAKENLKEVERFFRGEK